MPENQRSYTKPKGNLRKPNIRVAVEEAKEKKGYRKILPGDIKEELVTEGISRANNYIREKKYENAIRVLEQAYENSNQMEEEVRTKYGFAIIKRLKRIQEKTEPGNHIRDSSFDLAMKIQGKPHMQKKVLKDLSDYFSGALAIIGILGGFFFFLAFFIDFCPDFFWDFFL